MRVRFRDDVTLIVDEEALILYRGDQKITLRQVPQATLELVMRPDFELDTLHEEMQRFLRGEKLIVKLADNHYKGTNFERNCDYYECYGRTDDELGTTIQDKLRQKTVLILGCGGVGSVLADNLVRVGIRHLILVDDDRVARHNLNRQLGFRQKDVGKFKVDVLAAYLKGIQSDLVIQKTIARMTNADAIAALLRDNQVDLVINAADAPRDLDDIVWRACQSCQVPRLNLGVGYQTGFARFAYVEGRSTVRIPKGSIATTNMLVASLGAHLVLQHFLTGQKQSKRIDFKYWEVTDDLV